MKTFNKKDLITWANRHTVKVGDKGYFADSITGLHSNMTAGYVRELMSIFDNNNRCFSDGTLSYGFFLPVDTEPEKKKNYRPCKSIQEFYEAVNNYSSDSFPNKDFTNENFMYNLLGTDIHFRSKSTYVEYYSTIVSICKKDNTGIRILFRGKSYLSFEQIFESYDIELNGKWLPFGVIDED